MHVLLTGAFGNIGTSTLAELLARDHVVRVFELPTDANRKRARQYEDAVDTCWGDLREPADVARAVTGQDVVIHVAAIIPPLADERPALARAVNVGGTRNIIQACQAQPRPPRLVFTSSISVYGDRLADPYIHVTDPLVPSPGDAYAETKIECERLVRASGLAAAIFRLTYIVSPAKLEMDPLLFHVPLDTCIEICDTEDVGRALATAIELDEVWGNTYHLAGGDACRTTYRKYLNRMFEIFGLGRDWFPAEAFQTKDFHCGYMDTTRSQALLQYQRCTLEDYYATVREQVGIKHYLLKLVRYAARRYLLGKSEFYQDQLAWARVKRFFKRQWTRFSTRVAEVFGSS